MMTGKKNIEFEVSEYYESTPIKLKVKPNFKMIVSENLPSVGHRITIKADMSWKEIYKVWEQSLMSEGDVEIEIQIDVPHQYVLDMLDKRLRPRTE